MILVYNKYQINQVPILIRNLLKEYILGNMLICSLSLH